MEMVPLGQFLKSMPASQRDSFMFRMSMPRWDNSAANSVATSNAQRSNSNDSTRLFEDGKNYVRFQRSQREGKFSVPIGGRAAAFARQKRFESDSSWSAQEEAAFQKAFGKPSSEPVKEQLHAAPTGGGAPQQRGMYSNRYSHR